MSQIGSFKQENLKKKERNTKKTAEKSVNHKILNYTLWVYFQADQQVNMIEPYYLKLNELKPLGTSNLIQFPLTLVFQLFTINYPKPLLI